MKNIPLSLKMIVAMTALFSNSCYRSSPSVLSHSPYSSANSPHWRAPDRFNPEVYVNCEDIARALQRDYEALARLRISSGRNVFLYHQLLTEGEYYDGLHDENRQIPNGVRRILEAGGSWGVAFPDVGCPNMDRFYYEEEYIRLYNIYALRVFRDTGTSR